MPTNTMTFNQVATLLNSIQQQATGQAGLTATNTSDFVSVANTVLQTGYDPVMNAINQVLTRTVFSVRPYTRKFGIVEVPESSYGNHIRKLNIADKPVLEDDRYKWPTAYNANQVPPSGDGQTLPSMYLMNKPTVLQTNFYGQNVWSDNYPVFKDQLDCAFRGPDELGSFLGMVTQNMVDKLEQCRENMGRACVANFIGGLIDEAASDRVIHLLSEYNSLTGLSLTATTVYQPANYPAFIRWAYARILTISDLMTERSEAMQTIVNNLPIMRHTPKANQKMMIFSPASNMMTTMALADTYHEELLRLGAYETVNYWQSIKAPDSISVTPGRIGSNGAVVTGSAVTQANVFGVLFDEEALGYATTQQWSAPTPFDPRSGVSITWLHETQRLWNDHSEKGVVFLLD
jgi:hypothetical protein